jgi:hypothetical protein
MRRRGDGLLEVAIARHARKPTAKAWAAELDTFRKYFGIDDWPVARFQFDEGAQVTVYRQPAPTP